MNEFDRNLHEDIAAGEAWLGGFDTPPPSSETIARYKLAVRAELGMPQANGRRWLRLKHWHGAVAAAAMLMLAVTIGYESYNRYEGGGSAAEQVAVVPSYSYVPSLLPAFDESDSASHTDEAVAGEETEDLGDWSLSGGGLFAAINESGGTDVEESTNESGVLWSPSSDDATLEGVV